MRLPLGLVLAAAVACSSPTPEPTAEPASTTAALPLDAPPLAPGVLAAARGKNGEIRVEEAGGLRQLVIGEIVQGAAPIGDAAGKVGPDPIVSVVRALRPQARSVLVIGLGTGKTTMDLRGAGYEVTVVELEPVVIEFARTYFGFSGEAIARDGYRFVRDAEREWDVVLMDAFLGMQAPYDLTGRKALARMRARTAAGGLTIVRGLGEPRDHLFTDMARHLRGDHPGRTFVQLFGSGVGAEPQNLYLIAGDQPCNLVDSQALPVWPVRLEGQGPLWAEPTALGARRARLLGYVGRMPETGELTLDLPHWEMGAARYLLAGDGAATLAEELDARARFPTAGDIPSDGDTTATLYAVLGGGGVKRSEVRFSPLAAIVEGTVSLVSVVDPDAAGALPSAVRGDAATDARLPYGGALYRLEVDRIVWTLDRASWRAIDRRAGKHVRAAVKRLRKGHLGTAVEDLRRHLAALGDALEPYMPPRAEMEALTRAIDDEAGALSGALGRFELAAACDRAHAAARRRGQVVSVHARAVVAALRACALDRYEEAAAHPKDADAIPSAKRLLTLYTEAAADPATGDAARADAAAKLDGLRKKYRVLNPTPEPPPRPADPPANPPE